MTRPAWDDKRGEQRLARDLAEAPPLSDFMDIETPESMRARPPKKWLVQGLISRIGVSCIYGPSGAGKSFLALDMCAKISAGQMWFGHETVAAPVIYMTFEGIDGIGQRMAAYYKYHGPIGSNMRILSRRPGAERFNVKHLLHRDALVSWADGNGLSGGIVVLDTLIRSSDSFDENSSQEMMQVIESATDISQRLACNVTLIHHSGNSGDGPRGSSALKGAWDDGIRVAHLKTENDARWHWETDKIKDGPASGATPFQLNVVDMSTPDRMNYSSCVVIQGGETVPKPASRGHG